ncbi:hypothetical protein [Roseimaritima sediminicola]|uniref:hypothetical protein n=1 Tax=Roseimaritima sediminicola TaxID=2662066 RepID=UPI0012985405|nr:hypothetical protein [Roseimaritima sediminicola]
MSSSRLRLFRPEPPRSSEPTINLSVAQLVPLLVDAYQTDRVWLNDFGDEPVRVTSDLYEILLAYQQLRRSDAA